MARLIKVVNPIAGSWTTTPFTVDGFEATAVTRDQSQGEIWLCVESSATERVCCSQNIPHSGKQKFFVVFVILSCRTSFSSHS